MRAIALLGGLGTRLHPLTLRCPKPLLPLGHRPMFLRQVDQLKRAGVREVVLSLGHKAGVFRRELGDGRRWGVRFIYAIEKEPLGTGGALRFASRFVVGPTFVVNGDVLSDIDPAAMAAFHRRRKAEATIALTAVADPSAFGVVETGPGGRVLSFMEKPPPGRFSGTLINAGFYLLEPSVFREIPTEGKVSVEREVFPVLAARGRRVFGWRYRGPWSDLGTLASYGAAHAEFLRAGDDERIPGRLKKLLGTARIPR